MGAMPKPWVSVPDIQQEFFSQITASPRSILITDYDGTLAPFHLDKMKALPYPGVERRLARLLALANVRIVFVTGRAAKELETMLDFPVPVEIWGSHGREHIDSAGSYDIHPLTDDQVEALDNLYYAFVSRNLQRHLERKPASLAVHWRGEPLEDQRRMESIAVDLMNLHALGRGFEIIAFESGVEARAVGCTKADAVRTILRQEVPGAAVAYLGDDWTDEDAFPVLRGRGLSLLVRTFARESSADYWIDPPEELINFLDQWILAAGSRS